VGPSHQPPFFFPADPRNSPDDLALAPHDIGPGRNGTSYYVPKKVEYGYGDGHFFSFPPGAQSHLSFEHVVPVSFRCFPSLNFKTFNPRCDPPLRSILDVKKFPF